ncbi:MAG: GNAT family N-acetyltransferase [Anaerolineaceae bacterium]|nr:GNAT family N-acetyltransferase [Anaerolineaceae bacterium]NTV36012.1 GNAT family N-acetyltransferase [Anaerolineaceae bacterium]
MSELKLDFHTLTPERWDDLVTLFGPHGAVAGCWCMWWRISDREFRETSKDEHKALFQQRVDAGQPTGILAYDNDKPVGWVSVAPRAEYKRFTETKTRSWKVIDEAPVWCIVCFFVAARYRRKGVGEQLLVAAVEYARSQGASILEACPKDTAGEKANPLSIYYGTLSMYIKAGFEEVARFQPTYPIMRLKL